MKRNFLMIAASVAMLATACSPDGPNYPQGGDEPLTFSSNIGTSPATRAYDETWETGDAIGIYMDAGSQADNRTNVEHRTNGNGVFTAAPGVEAIYLPQGSTGVSFIAYYPYKSNISNYQYPIDVTDQSDLGDIDLLWSNNVTNYTTGNNPHLVFYHKLTKVVFNIRDQRDGATLAGATVSLDGLNTRGEFNLSTGAVASSSTPGNIAANMVSISGVNATAEAIVIPTSSATYDILVNIPADGTSNPATFTLNSQNYQPGQKHIYTLNVVDTGGGDPVLVLIDGSSEIENWNEMNGGSLTVDKNDGGDPETPTINASSPAQVPATATSVSVNCTVTGAGTITVGSRPSWISAANVVGTTVNFTLQQNNNSSARQASVTLSYGGASTSVTISQAGTTVTPPQTVTYYTETFGEGDHSSNRPKIDAFTGWDNQTVTYGTSSGVGADIRSTNSILPHIWFPNTGQAAGDNDFVISGLPAGYTGITLKYDVAANGAAANANLIEVFANGVSQTSKVSVTLGAMNTYSTISISIPDNTTTLRFFAPASNGHPGMRLDNISLTGTK